MKIAIRGPEVQEVQTLDLVIIFVLKHDYYFISPATVLDLDSKTLFLGFRSA